MAPRRPIDDPQALDMRDAIVRGVLQAISGVRIGKVVSYDPLQGTATVQPTRRRRVWGKPEAENPIAGAVVCWWRFGRMVLAGELEPEDEVLMVTTDREHRPWWLKGGLVDPSSERMHSASDTIVLPWISNLTRPILARAARTFFMGREDATAGITIPMDVPARIEVDAGPLGIVLGSAAVSPVVLHPAFAAAFTTYTGAVSAAGATHAAIMPPTAIGNGAFIVSLTAATAALAIALAVPAIATVKVVAE